MIVLNKNSNMEKIKKHWKVILIVLLVIFGMNKCTTSCNRGSTINKQTVQIEELIKQNDSLLKVCDMQSLQIDEMGRGRDMLSGLATGNQQLLMDSIGSLVNQNAELRAKNVKLQGELNSTKKELKRLKDDLK